MSTSQGTNYDVFVSFRGPDTRHGFVDCLFERMKDAGIRASVDSKSLHVGKVIRDRIMHAIDKSRIFMPVLSKGYASSGWCMLELEHIMRGCSGRVVWPIFYDVSVDDVKLRTSLYTGDLQALEKKHGTKIVDLWRNCLLEICKIKGWKLEEFQGQGKLINEIIQHVLYKTKKRYKEAIKDPLDDQFDGVEFRIVLSIRGARSSKL